MSCRVLRVLVGCRVEEQEQQGVWRDCESFRLELSTRCVGRVGRVGQGTREAVTALSRCVDDGYPGRELRACSRHSACLACPAVQGFGNKADDNPKLQVPGTPTAVIALIAAVAATAATACCVLPTDTLESPRRYARRARRSRPPRPSEDPQAVHWGPPGHSATRPRSNLPPSLHLLLA